MSIQCTNCGQALPRDDARFCSRCGTFVQPRPLSPQVLPSPKDAPIASDAKGKVHKDRSALREQIAQQPTFQPPSRPRPTQEFPPPGISEINTLEQSKTSTPNIEKDQPPLTEVVRNQAAEIPTTSLSQVEAKQPAQHEPLTEKVDESIDTDQPDTPTMVITPRKSQVRELHVKVWEQDELAASPEKPGPEDPSKELANRPPDSISSLTVPPKGKPSILAEFPTMPVNVEGINGQNRPPWIKQGSSAPGADSKMPPPGLVLTQGSVQSPQLQPADLTPMINREAQEQPIPIEQYTPAFVQPAPTRLRRSPFPFLFALLLLFVVVAGGLLAWTLVYQPFTVPPVSQPQQSFQNAALGVALSYPNGWTVQVDQNNGSAQFSDSTHTARFSIVVVAATGQDTGKYLLQEAKQLGITGAKSGPPLSFAKTSWQQVQGSVVQGGVNYTRTLLVTMHANRLYSVIQQAPQATYADEDQVVFSPMHSSFQFLL